MFKLTDLAIPTMDLLLLLLLLELLLLFSLLVVQLFIIIIIIKIISIKIIFFKYYRYYYYYYLNDDKESKCQSEGREHWYCSTYHVIPSAPLHPRDTDAFRLRRVWKGVTDDLAVTHLPPTLTFTEIATPDNIWKSLLRTFHEPSELPATQYVLGKDVDFDKVVRKFVDLKARKGEFCFKRGVWKRYKCLALFCIIILLLDIFLYAMSTTWILA